MPDKHFQASRGWALVRNKLQLTPNEQKHLVNCERCHYWLTGFTEMAKRAGFEIACIIPPCENKRSASA